MTGGKLSKALAIAAFAAAVPATSHAVDVRPIFKAGYDFGGDTLVTVGTTGGGSSSKSLKANEGLFLGGGASILTDSKDIEVEVSLSYKFNTIAAQNGDIDWSVLPLDALVFYHMPNVRLGGGLTYHMNPKLSGSGAASDLKAKYDDALGFVLQADYVLKDRYNFGLRYTNVSYKASSVQSSNTIVATTPASNPKTNGVGFVFTLRF